MHYPSFVFFLQPFTSLAQLLSILSSHLALFLCGIVRLLSFKVPSLCVRAGILQGVWSSYSEDNVKRSKQMRIVEIEGCYL